jgi:hypothetical protein
MRFTAMRATRIKALLTQDYDGETTALGIIPGNDGRSCSFRGPHEAANHSKRMGGHFWLIAVAV